MDTWLLLLALLWALVAVTALGLRWRQRLMAATQELLAKALEKAKPATPKITFTPAEPKVASPFDSEHIAQILHLVQTVAAVQERMLTRHDEQRFEQRLAREVSAGILFTLDRLETLMAKTIPDQIAALKAQIVEQTADITKLSSTSAGVKNVIDMLLAANAGLKAQIQQLIDAGGGDPTVLVNGLQDVLDGFAANEQAIRAEMDNIAKAVVAGTPAAV